MDRWHTQVKDTVPADRLLVWNPADGWEPMCDFLQVEVPADPLPRLNDTLAFREGIIGGAIDSVRDWWDARERSAQRAPRGSPGRRVRGLEPRGSGQPGIVGETPSTFPAASSA